MVNTPVNATEVKDYYGTIDTSARFSKARNMGEINVLYPIKLYDKSVYLVNYIGKRSNKNGAEFNLGLAKRTIKNKKIHGVYGFFDIRKTPTGNTFTQITVGKEVISKRFDYRVNAYIPISSKKPVAKNTRMSSNSGSLIALTDTYESAMYGVDAEYGKLRNHNGNEFGAWAVVISLHQNKVMHKM